MRVSYKWLSELVDLGKAGGPKGVAEALTRRGLEVEDVLPLGKGFEKVVTVQILERNPHPQADRLSLCKVSLGSGEPLEIVCGAQNMKAGDRVALAQVGAELPNGMTIALSKIRGVTSNGMLCSEEELRLKEKSEGILILPPSTPLGKPLADVLGLDDTVLVFKPTANRGDCLSHLGLARELAAALGQKVKYKEPKALDPKGSPISLHLDAGEAAPQFWGCMIEGVKIGPSPDWVVRRLETLGSRSINNVVDATNLALLELGHPMHAYDADLIDGRQLRVRLSKDGEELPLLDGKSVKLNGTELVIADGKRAVGLAGVMGGGNSEVRDATTRVFLECAEFAPVQIRRASTRHQRKTDAAQRFEKGIDPAGAARAIARLAELVTELAGGKITGATVAALPSRDPKKAAKRAEIAVSPSYLNSFLGTDLTEQEIEGALGALGCAVSKQGKDWKVTPPSWRLDLSIKEDLAEEVARHAGYDRIATTIPTLSSQPTPAAMETTSAQQILLGRAKSSLARSGLMEALNYAFTSEAWLKEWGFAPGAKVLNPLSEEHEALVPSLLPGLIANALHNWRHTFGSEAVPIRLFEIRPTFQTAPGEPVRSRGETETSVAENWKLAFALSGPRLASGLRAEQGEVGFSDVKAVVESLFDAMGTRGVRLLPLSSSRKPQEPFGTLLHPGQSVEILAGNGVAGYFGLLHPGLARKHKMRAPLWVGELDWAAITKLSRTAAQNRTFKPWSEFPPMERDFALVVKDEVTADKITQVALKAGKPLAKVAKVFDIYRGSQVPEGMTSVAVRVIFFTEGRSLQESETEAASAQILETWKNELGAELRS